jgi:hypothetical protein
MPLWPHQYQKSKQDLQTYLNGEYNTGLQNTNDLNIGNNVGEKL